MAYEQRDNSGTLGKNPRREKDSHPTHSGQCVIDGKPFWISAWVKEGRDGSKFFSLSFKPKMAREQGAQANPRGRTDDDLPYDDQIPFAVAWAVPAALLAISLVASLPLVA